MHWLELVWHIHDSSSFQVMVLCSALLLYYFLDMKGINASITSKLLCVAVAKEDSDSFLITIIVQNMTQSNCVHFSERLFFYISRGGVGWGGKKDAWSGIGPQ